MSELGFIILRHVNSKLTNLYWNTCYDCIRKYYPDNLILIIDDNSNYDYIKKRHLHQTIIINSAYHGRGELLPYYYYLHNNLFDKAIIIHDSLFINTRINTDTNTYKFLWDFEHDWDQIEDETSMINLFNDKELIKFYEDKNLWKGCFGCMTIITHNYLTYINSKYDISKLLGCILNKYNRCSFERVIGCLLQYNERSESLFGDIHKYCKWGINFNEKYKYNHLPLIKVWTGR